MLKNTIVALDQMTKDQIQNLIPKLKELSYFKIGLELFNQHGREYIEQFVQENKTKVFLDLKLHDIPKTVECSIKSLSGLDIEFLTIHLSGGKEMITSALKARDKYLPNTKILGVSYLTSLGPEDFKEVYGIEKNMIETQFKRIFRLAAVCKVDGLISSPHELHIIKKIEQETHYKFIKVTPGIRLNSNNKNDQKRVMGPSQALEHGANFIVIGRAITQATSIYEALKQIKNT